MDERAAQAQAQEEISMEKIKGEEEKVNNNEFLHKYAYIKTNL